MGAAALRELWPEKWGLKETLIEPAGLAANNAEGGGPQPNGGWGLPRRAGRPARWGYLRRKMGIPCCAPQIGSKFKGEAKTVNPAKMRTRQFPSTQGLSRAPALCFAPRPHAIRSRARDFYALRAHEDVR